MHPVSVIRCSDYNNVNVRRALEKAVDLVGGIEHYVQKGKRVLIKPNLLGASNRKAGVVTDPAVVLAMVEMCISAGASEIMIGDSPATGCIKPVLKKSGYLELFQNSKVKFVDFDESVPIKGEYFPELILSKTVCDADVIINIAKVKTHGHTGLTMAVKNCFGYVHGRRKSQWHLKTGRDEKMFSRMILDVYNSARPALNILDAVIGMEGNGPSGGTPRNFNAILAGPDGLSVDVVMSEILGYPLNRLPIHKSAMDLGIAPKSIKDVDIHGDSIKNLKIKNLIPAKPGDLSIFRSGVFRFLRGHATSKPYVIPDNCRQCNKCVEICSVKCIAFPKGAKAPEIDRSECIHCYCCQEICPHKAIEIRDGFVSRFFYR